MYEAVQTLQAHGHQGYLVGGGVRDRLLHRRSYDYDIATDASLIQLKALFKKTDAVGSRFGTLGVHVSGHRLDLSRLRTDSTATRDHRHPDAVQFIAHLPDDLARRDFTMNAIAYDPIANRLIDPFQGQQALKQQQIIPVGEPDQRFKEDTLRIFRAYRFVAQLGFCLTVRIPVSRYGQYRLPAWTRLTQEFNALLHAPNAAQALALMQLDGWLDFLFPNAIWPSTWSTLATQPTILKWPFFLYHSQCTLFTLPKAITTWSKRVIAHNFNWKRCCLTASDLALSGHDLKDRGYTGVSIGQTQAILLDYIATYPAYNTVAALDNYLNQNRNRQAN